MSTNEDQSVQLPRIDQPFYGIISERDTFNPIWSGGAILHEAELGQPHTTDPEATIARAQALSGYGKWWIIKALRVSLAEMESLKGDSTFRCRRGERMFAPVIYEPPFDGEPSHPGAFVMMETRIWDAANPELQIERLKEQLRKREDSIGFLVEFPLPAVYRRPSHHRVD